MSDIVDRLREAAPEGLSSCHVSDLDAIREAAHEIERQRAEIAALRKRAYDGSKAEPTGCPTPGACSCPE